MLLNTVLRMFLTEVKGHILLPKILPEDQILGGGDEAHNQLLYLNTWKSEETVGVS